MARPAYSEEQIAAANRLLDGAPPQRILRWAVRTFYPRLTMATAFGAEGCCLIHMLAEIEPRVRRCFEAGALATGCDLEIVPESKPYAEFRADEAALASYRRNAEALGREFATGNAAARMNRASTDMGNVSQVVPAIHPYVGIGSLPALNHQREFAAHCVGAAAEQAIRDAATALAWTAIDVAIERGDVR